MPDWACFFFYTGNQCLLQQFDVSASCQYYAGLGEGTFGLVIRVLSARCAQIFELWLQSTWKAFCIVARDNPKEPASQCLPFDDAHVGSAVTLSRQAGAQTMPGMTRPGSENCKPVDLTADKFLAYYAQISVVSSIQRPATVLVTSCGSIYF